MPNNISFDVNNDAAIAYTTKLLSLHKSAFPVAVRATLNDAAFDMKKNTLPDSFRSHFVIRAPTFIKRFTSVQKANGFDVDTMSSAIGFVDQGEQKVDAAIRGIEDNEVGGKVTTGLAYLPGSRVGGSADRAVTRKNRFSKDNIIEIQNIYNITSRQRVGTTKSRFVASAIMAAKTGKFIKLRKDGRNYYIKVSKVSINKGKVDFTSKIVYASRNSSNKSIKATHFVEHAAGDTIKKMSDFYKKNAEKQFTKYMK